MNRELRLHEIHPPYMAYRLVRRLRSLRRVRGWERCANILASMNRVAPFSISNNGVAFEGSISSFIDRRVYLFGGYEDDAIELFLSLVPSGKRGVILDVGANIGTHALAIARSFRHVHSFEPNAAIWASFERNVALNSWANITLHKVGLADISADQRFYSIDKNNFGLGTFSPVEQYDMSLKVIGTSRVEKGDDYIAAFGIGAIDAIKIDVQGYEPEVLLGLRETLRRHRPVVWFEFAAGTKTKLRNAEELRRLFPYEIELSMMTPKASLFIHSLRLEAPADNNELAHGDYVVVPAGEGVDGGNDRAPACEL